MNQPRTLVLTARLGRPSATVQRSRVLGQPESPNDSKNRRGAHRPRFFGQEHFMTSWRYYNIKQASSSQVDTGGYFSGDALVCRLPYPAIRFKTVPGCGADQQHYQQCYQRRPLQLALRNWWAWARNGAPPQNCTLLYRTRRSARNRERRGRWRSSGSRSLQREQSANPHPFLDGHDQMLRRTIFPCCTATTCSSLAPCISATGTGINATMVAASSTSFR